ncbi:DUF6113 family protein [Frankia sp. QA3]|uniref:DUF6113 family protein n=1 Tax=Frankia sp. QA3 TaxID=710111 RepID=UPI000305175A|nr:DUF6113 family protein [Frankia sp. QA3]
MTGSVGPGGKTWPPGRPGTAAPTPEPEPSRIFLGVSYALGVVLGVGLGLYGVFLVPDGPRPGGMLLSVGLLLALVGNGAAALLLRWLTGTRLGPMTVLIGWTPVVLLLAASRPEGDLLLRSSATAYAFLLLGGLSPIVVAVLGGARRGLTAIPPPR